MRRYRITLGGFRLRARLAGAAASLLMEDMIWLKKLIADV
jgi:hypothetical protein